MEIYLVGCGFILFDIITGLIKALYTGTFNSTAMRQGGYHKATEILAIFGANLLEYVVKYVDIGINLPLLSLTVTYIAIMELISIMENMCAVNPEMAKLFNPYLEKLKEKKEN